MEGLKGCIVLPLAFLVNFEFIRVMKFAEKYATFIVIAYELSKTMEGLKIILPLDHNATALFSDKFIPTYIVLSLSQQNIPNISC